MNLAQENFDRAVRSGRDTLDALSAHGADRTRMVLATTNVRTLRALAWDLEAIQAAVRIELNERSNSPMDLG